MLPVFLFSLVTFGFIRAAAASPACADGYTSASECKTACRAKMGWPGFYMSSDVWGAVVVQTESDIEAWVQAACAGAVNGSLSSSNSSSTSSSKASSTSISESSHTISPSTDSTLGMSLLLPSSASMTATATATSSSGSATTTSDSIAASSSSITSISVIESSADVPASFTDSTSTSGTSSFPVASSIPPPMFASSSSTAWTSTFYATASEVTSEAVPTSSTAATSTSDIPNGPVSTSTSTSSASGSGATSDEIAQYLSAHNTVRAQYGASDLTWSDDLATAAQGYSTNCVLQHSGGTLGPYGENLAAGTGDSYGIASAIGSWVAEASQYSSSDPQASHFTQVVWKATTQVGCGMTECDGIFPASFGKAQFYVCEYYVQGNVVGEFATNVQA